MHLARNRRAAAEAERAAGGTLALEKEYSAGGEAQDARWSDGLPQYLLRT
jgi:hypothetical protein